jgi:hypothetical protein
MTAEEYLKRMQDPLWYGEQDENGVDLSLIRANLQLTPEDRLLKGDQGRQSALELLRYARQHREQERKQPASNRADIEAPRG